MQNLPDYYDSSQIGTEILQLKQELQYGILPSIYED